MTQLNEENRKEALRKIDNALLAFASGFRDWEHFLRAVEAGVWDKLAKKGQTDVYAQMQRDAISDFNARLMQVLSAYPYDAQTAANAFRMTLAVERFGSLCVHGAHVEQEVEASIRYRDIVAKLAAKHHPFDRTNRDRHPLFAEAMRLWKEEKPYLKKLAALHKANKALREKKLPGATDDNNIFANSGLYRAFLRYLSANP